MLVSKQFLWLFYTDLPKMNGNGSRAWRCTPSVSALRSRQWVSVHSRPVWSTWEVPGQPGLHTEILTQKVLVEVLKNASYVKKKECNTVLILVTFRVQDKTTRNRERMTKRRPSGAGGFFEITVTKQEGQGREMRGDYTSLHLSPPVPPIFLSSLDSDQQKLYGKSEWGEGGGDWESRVSVDGEQTTFKDCPIGCEQEICPSRELAPLCEWNHLSTACVMLASSTWTQPIHAVTSSQ